jgi:hypothetical protein
MARPTRRQLLIWFLAPALLVGVAGVHAYLAAAKNQTPWEGGGFGMFSTVDKRQARFVRCSLRTPEDTARVRLPEHLHRYVERLRARPTPTRVESLAQYLARATWIKSDSSRDVDTARNATVPPPQYRFLPSYETSDRPAVTVVAVRVEVWRYRFVSRPYGLDADLLLSATQLVEGRQRAD